MIIFGVVSVIVVIDVVDDDGVGVGGVVVVVYSVVCLVNCNWCCCYY